ncbi:cupin domain-containing protein [Agrilactobacillus yilanensis]|uniref:Cupin domain-containing protein n=1 Tax=Agrilactobacillus yilanensis TaxID=2485997 RepID=A0ABW4J539_9LACO
MPIEEDQMSSETLVQRDDLGMTLFSLDKDEEIQAHSSTGDALVQILSGTAEITIANEKYTVQAGQCIVMPANIKHALFAVEAFQMLLTVVKPEKE